MFPMPAGAFFLVRYCEEKRQAHGGNLPPIRA